MPKSEQSGFVIRHSSLIRHSGFVIRHFFSAYWAFPGTDVPVVGTCFER